MFRREWTKATVTVDCNAYTSDVRLKTSDDTVPQQQQQQQQEEEGLKIDVTDQASFSVMVDGELWLRSAPLRAFTAGWHQPEHVATHPSQDPRSGGTLSPSASGTEVCAEFTVPRDRRFDS